MRTQNEIDKEVAALNALDLNPSEQDTVTTARAWKEGDRELENVVQRAVLFAGLRPQW